MEAVKDRWNLSTKMKRDVEVRTTSEERLVAAPADGTAEKGRSRKSVAGPAVAREAKRSAEARRKVRDRGKHEPFRT